MATSCSSTCGGVKNAVAQVMESIRFWRASERGIASGSCDPAREAALGFLLCSARLTHLLQSYGTLCLRSFPGLIECT